MDGTSSIKTEFLVANNSPHKIEQLKIIYPNKIKVTPSKLSKVLKWIGYPITQPFEDTSYSLLQKNEDAPYDFFGRSVNYEIGPNSSWAACLTIHIKNFDDDQTVPHVGLVNKNRNEDILEKDASLDDASHALLQKNYFTALRYVFNRAMEPGEKRWIQLTFNYVKTAKLSKHLRHRLLLKIINSLTYHYQISGPYSVRDQFLMKVSKLPSKNLRDYLNAQGLINGESSTTYDILRIQATPGRMEQFINYSYDGNIKQVGNLPRYHVREDDRRYYTYYQWETIKSKNGKFLLNFQAKPFYYPYALLSLASFTVASTSLAIVICKTFKLIP